MGKKRKKRENQLVQGVKYEANNPAGRWAAVGIAQITAPVPMASARGTKEPWRSDSNEDTASTSGHMGRITATTERPKATDFMHWLGFYIKQKAKITQPKEQGASPSLEVTWPGSVAPTVRPFLTRDEIFHCGNAPLP